MPSPGGQVSGMVGDGPPRTMAGWAALCGIPSTSRRATTRWPGGAELIESRSRNVEGCTPGHRAVGLRQVDGMPHSTDVVASASD